MRETRDFYVIVPPCLPIEPLGGLDFVSNSETTITFSSHCFETRIFVSMPISVESVLNSSVGLDKNWKLVHEIVRLGTAESLQCLFDLPEVRVF